MLEAPAIIGSGKGQVFAILLSHAERLFSCVEHVTSRFEWSTVSPRLTRYYCKTCDGVPLTLESLF